MAYERGIIFESEINLIKNRMNRGKEVDVSRIWEDGIEISPEQTVRGLSFLTNLWQTPKGKVRKNNPFGYREEKALETCEKIYLRGFYDNSKYGQRPFYLPLYEVIGKNEDGEYVGFEYYCDGKVNIVG